MQVVYHFMQQWTFLDVSRECCYPSGTIRPNGFVYFNMYVFLYDVRDFSTVGAKLLLFSFGNF